MSTLDAQLLTLGSMLTRDVLDQIPEDAHGSRDVRRGRLFGGAVALAVFALWRASGQTIFGLASIAFSGYVTLTPLLLLGVRWRRFNAKGALASMLAGNGVYALALASSGGFDALSPAWLGFLPVVWGFLAALAAGVAVSLASDDQAPAVTGAAFGDVG